MVEDFAPLNLRARLSALQDRIAEARTKLEAHGAVGEHSEELTKFATQHDAIRGSLDSEGTVTELQHSKATVQTDSLEKELKLWLESIEHRYNEPAPRGPNISV
ncbi:MAG: hypothetical protein J0H37_03395 [Hyphomicrobium denitrificans]|uniref:hypothetical protein n=1 Tax=Hyphomicrobium sp. GJ21 TaxID=113574 RepID=UPI000622BC83|nr:hypothetical protein [Hyphomicrobium sp. GJ21]MBN9281305.1 hypothetical protein [Hyphomicrobium denitrificans]CEJ83430.1 conserved hypothetical protein [Hyphomicrobium sp. GJ21]